MSNKPHTTEERQSANPMLERLENLASYWEKGSQHKPMPEEYRRALRDCAKELREALK